MRRAISLVELTVVIGVVGLLASLSLPAVLRARAAAARLDCASRHAQMAVAAQAHMADHLFFPIGAYRPLNASRPAPEYSLHAQLLRYVEQADIYNSVNFEQRPGSAANTTAASRRVAVFMCPSEWGSGIILNLKGNAGPHPFVVEAKYRFENFGMAYGLFTPHLDRIGPNAVPDGLSHTALFSERVGGDLDDDRYSAFQDFAGGGGLAQTADAWAENCRLRGNPGPHHWSAMGAQWLAANAGSFYNHTLTPNSIIPDCGAKPEGPVLLALGAVAARSYHSDGVNVSFADGHVRFVTSNVDLSVWRAVGGRNDGITIESF